MLDFKSNLIEFYNLDFKQHNLGNKQHIFVLVFLEVHIKNATFFILRRFGCSWFMLNFLIAYFLSNNSAIAVDLT